MYAPHAPYDVNAFVRRHSGFCRIRLLSRLLTPLPARRAARSAVCSVHQVKWRDPLPALVKFEPVLDGENLLNLSVAFLSPSGPGFEGKCK